MRNVIRILPASQLDGLILETHAEGDGARLAVLYEEAGEREAAAGHLDAACFFWTQAWIFALDSDARTVVERVERCLAANGRLGPVAHAGAISSTAGT